MYPVIRVDPARSEGLEQLGTKRKFWFREGAKRMLFKAEERGTGEDWAEKIACELAAWIGLPHVHYELAIETGTEKPGVVCESCSTGYLGLPLGNQLLLERDPRYPGSGSNRYRVREHTVHAVSRVLQTLKPVPVKWATRLPDQVKSALDIFAGYAMLDAWIANQDRHHENWAALRLGQDLFLAPSFDHGAALARNLSDTERKDRLSSADHGRRLPNFAARAKSAFYSDEVALSPMTTLEAWQGFAELVPDAASAWVARLARIDGDSVREVIGGIPPHRMSGITRDFTAQLLAENQRRIVGSMEP